MPNYCCNKISLRQPVSDELRSFLTNHGFSFAAMNRPVCSDTEGSAASCHAHMDAWGTPHDLEPDEARRVAVELFDAPDFCSFFATAWHPPGVAVGHLSRRFPKDEMTLVYGEPGNALCGRLTFKAGFVDRYVPEDSIALWPADKWSAACGSAMRELMLEVGACSEEEEP